MSPERGPATPREDCESTLVWLFMWKVVEADFWRHLRAVVSADFPKLVSNCRILVRLRALPPEPESSFLEGLDDCDWAVPDWSFPVACDDLACIVPNATRLLAERRNLQVDNPRD